MLAALAFCALDGRGQVLPGDRYALAFTHAPTAIRLAPDGREIVLEFAGPLADGEADRAGKTLGPLLEGYAEGYGAIRFRLTAPAREAEAASSDPRTVVITPDSSPDDNPEDRRRLALLKDVKTFIRAVGLLRRQLPEARGEILGPLEEDPGYARECAALIHQLGLDDAVTLQGAITVQDWLGRIDVNVLTSISEAQPLTILEAGAAGVPCIASDVGACREMIEGDPPGEQKLRAGGAITPSPTRPRPPTRSRGCSTIPKLGPPPAPASATGCGPAF